MFRPIFPAILVHSASLATLTCALLEPKDAGESVSSAAPLEAETAVHAVAVGIEENRPAYGNQVVPPHVLSQVQPDWNGGRPRPTAAPTTPLTKRQDQNMRFRSQRSRQANFSHTLAKDPKTGVR